MLICGLELKFQKRITITIITISIRFVRLLLLLWSVGDLIKQQRSCLMMNSILLGGVFIL